MTTQDTAASKPEAEQEPSSSPLSTFWREVSTFGFVGAFAAVIDLGLFNVLIHGALSDKYTTAKILSGAVATVFAWLGNRYWTFREREGRPVHHEVALFFGVNGVALAVTSAWVAFAHYVLDVTKPFWVNVHVVLGIGLGTLMRFVLYRTVVFGKAAEQGAPPTHHDAHEK
ncbi:GtrA family protein [Dermacoccus abyssi]|uniref:GtrA family protein n=1 Tax=Dermacoccus abyssi TaxID=322596 RepID=UPI0021A59373|nr:GtrA family protein [Dermacoccus abyssi]MCT1986417.1 GtrA family protein [Dermacoccus abyssi]